MDVDEHICKRSHFKEGYTFFTVDNLVTEPGMGWAFWSQFGWGWFEVMTLIGDGGCGGINWFRDGGKDEGPGFKFLIRFEGTVFEDLTNPAETSGCACLVMPIDVNKVIAKSLVSHGRLNFRYDFVFHFLFVAVLNPTILDDAYLLCFFVLCLRHP